MPTYDYKCDACGHALEMFQSIKAEVVRKCPKCKKLKLKRLIGTGAALLFKGSGFYITDYRSEAYKTSAKGDSAPASTESKTGTDSKSGGDAKPAGESKSGGETKPSKPAGDSKGPSTPSTPAVSASPAPAPKAEPKPAARRDSKKK